MRRRLLGLSAVLLLIPAGTWAQEGESDAEEAPTQVVAEDGAATDEEAPWWVSPYGYVRASLEFVENDSNFDFVGENNGFVLHNARLGIEGGHRAARFSFRLSVDGAADLRDNLNDPAGDLEVRLRDAYVREDFAPWMGLVVGQFKAPFSAEELRPTAELTFASRAVGLEGVRVGRGFEQPGIVVDRELGAMLSPREPITFGPIGFAYYMAITNGNGDNQILNDNSDLAYYPRIELYVLDMVRLGGSMLFNNRTVGELPNRFDEEDTGWSTDVLFRYTGLEIFGQLTSLTTAFPTTGTPEQEQLAYHVQVSYMVDIEGWPVLFGPAYRYAFFDPRAEGGVDDSGVDLESFQLTYHTIGLNVNTRDFPVNTLVNYTITNEQAPRELDNNRFEWLLQLTF